MMGAMTNDDERAIASYGSLEKLPWHQRTSVLATEVEETGKDEQRFRRRQHFLSFRTLVMITVVVALSIGFLVSWQTQPQRSFESDDSQAEYEYILAGGGPAGILVASKLADYLMTAFPLAPPKVLLLESGTDTQSSVDANIRQKQSGLSSKNDDFRLNKFDMPLLWSGVASSRDNDEEHHWPIKKTLLARALGGCGLHNAMIYIRSLPNDFERWNLKGWTWDDVLPHYKGLEQFVGGVGSSPSFWNESRVHKPWRGHNGPIVTAPADPSIDGIAPLFVESAVNSGVPLAAEGFNDPDASKRVGVGYYEFNIRNGVRDSVAQAMLGKADGRRIPSNLEVRTGATVTRIIIETLTNGTPEAVAVEYFTNNSTGYQKAILTNGGEAILSAGAIMTPQLLANSGIGLGEHGKVANLSGVGKNVQDHPVIALGFELNANLAGKAPSMFTLASEFQNYFSSVEHLRQAKQEANDKELNQWASLLGPIGTAGFSAGAFLKSPWAQYESPDIQLTVFPRVVEPHVIRHDEVDADNDPYLLESRTMLVTVALLQPEGRYEIQTPKSIFGSTITADSEIDTGNVAFGESFGFRLPTLHLPENTTSHLTDMDVKRLSWGMEKVRQILSFDPLKNLTQGELYPGSDVVGSELRNYIRANHLTNSHWVGSTKMGSANDPMAVVDERLRVRGVESLRVVDAGVIPHIPNGNTHSTVCVVASRAAEMIIADRSHSIRSSQKTS